MSGDLHLHLVENFDDAQQFLSWLGNRRDWLGLDTETEGLVLGKHRVRMTQFGDMHDAWAIPMHLYGGLVQEVFDKYRGNYAIHNAKFDIGRLKHEGFNPPNWTQIHDTYVMSFLHDNQEPNRGLKRLAKKYMGIDAQKGELALHRVMKEQGLWWDTIPWDNQLYWEYAALDATLHAGLAEKLWNTSGALYREAYDTEMGSMRVVMNMEAHGLAVDREYTERLYSVLMEERKQLLESREHEGREWDFLREEGFRPNFTQEIIAYFANEGVAVPVKRSKKTGKISVDDEVLSKMDHPVAKKIQRARHLKSWCDNYLIKLLENTYQGRVHPHINTLGGEDKGRTGRMSITDPALSVLEKSSLIRDCIVATEGQSLLSVDYENQELRIIASICQSQGMIDAFATGLDMHKQTAAKMYGIPMEEVTAPQKTNAKRAMFTKAYGGKEGTFAAYMGLTYDEGARYYQAISHLYPEMDEYIEHQKATIKHNKVDGYGHIFLGDGRRLNIPANLSFTAVSYSSQGEAATVLKKKLCDLDAAGLGDYLVLPVHDEAIFEVPDEDFEEVKQEAMKVMECHDFTVTLTVDGSGKMKKWGDDYPEDRPETAKLLEGSML